MSKTNLHLNISIDSDLLEAAENLFEALGMDLGTAVNIFISKAVHEKGIPFDVKFSKTELDSMRSILEAMGIINDILSSDLDSLMAEDQDEETEEADA